ncbi:hypothetical protein BDC45DRAFT_570773 [Circinella umbellata]|nr:hypothetical protein BDC45DRAFT_570773 [Circinella umbellata]
MSIASPLTKATTIINTAIPLSSFEKVKNAYNHRDHDEIIRQATNTIAHIEQLELFLILEHRAHSFSMKSKFGAAEQDAETMIKYAPSLPQGYLCFGKILSMQGKQARALKVYQEGLEKVPTNDSVYEQLLQAKKRVDEKNNQHFDLVSVLPLEIKEEIVLLLSEEERSNLFHVSTTWSQWLENCQKAWKYIYNDHDYAGNIAVSQVLPKIAKHINHLIIKAVNKEAWYKYLEHLENGHFRNLKSLKLSDDVGDIMSGMFSTNSIMSLMNAFWKVRYTLTKIDIICYQRGAPITITNILFLFPYLETLVFWVFDPLECVLGELEALPEPHNSLVDLTLYTGSTSGDALKPISKWCPCIQRLRLESATPCALDAVTDYFRNVEMLGYNIYCELPSLHQVLNQVYNNNKPIIPVISKNDIYTKQEQGRLRAFYSGNGSRGISGDEFLRLLQKNQKTLEIIHANMGMTDQQNLNNEPHDNFRPDYAIKAASIVLNLDRLEKLKLSPDIYEVYEPLFYQKIGPSLKYFKLVRTSDLSTVVDALINSQQMLETLGFTYIWHFGWDSENDQENTLATQCLVRLFNEYAATSLAGFITAKKLRNVIFDYCCYVSDDVLDVLSNIKTIEGLSFLGRSKITPQGFKDFFIKLKKQNVRITNLKLGGIEGMVDSNMLLDIINSTEYLESLHLYYMDGLTGDDIKAVIHSAKKLNTLVLKRCDVDSEDIMTFVNNTRRFKCVKIIEYYDDSEDMLNSDFDVFD